MIPPLWHSFHRNTQTKRIAAVSNDIPEWLLPPIRMATVTVKNEDGAILAVLYTGLPVLIRERNGVTVDIE